MLGQAFWKITQLALDETSKHLQAQLRGDGDEGEDDEAEPADDAVFFQQLGVLARPIVQDTLRALGFRFGSEVILTKIWDKAKMPTGIDEGETRVFSVGEVEACLRLRGDGQIELRSKDGQPLRILANDATVEITASGAVNVTAKSGEDLTLNGGSAKVAIVGTKTTNHAHDGSGMTAGPYPVSGMTQNTQPSVIDDGAAAHVKA